MSSLQPVMNGEGFKAAYIGICFMVLFASSQTLVYMQKSIMSSITFEVPSYDLDGYVSLGLAYFVFSISTLLSPFLVSSANPRILFMACSLTNIFHPLSFIMEKVWITYMSIILYNIAQALIWVGHGNYIIGLSSKKNLSRNIGIFWFFYSWSFALGNLYGVVRLNGQVRLDRATRTSILIALCAISCVAFCLFFFVKGTKTIIEKKNFTDAMMTTWKLFWSKPILVLLITFLYMGFEQVFGQTIMGPSIGFSHQFGSITTELIAISGICYGLGQALAGVSQMTLGRRLVRLKYGRSCLMLLGFLIQATGSIFLAISLPENCIFGDTYDKALISIKYGLPLTLIAAHIEGLGDGIINNQVYPVLGEVDPTKVSHSVALFKFTKNLTSSGYLGVTTKLGLRLQMATIILAGSLNVVSFSVVDSWISKRKLQEETEERVFEKPVDNKF